MNKKIVYGGIGAGLVALPVAMGFGAWQAGKLYNKGNDIPAVTSPAPELTQPNFVYARNLSEDLVRAARTLENVYRTQFNKGMEVFHIGPQNEHYVVVRGTDGTTIAEAYFRASKWGVIDPKTPVRLVMAPASADTPKTPLLLASPHTPYEEFIDDKRHGAYKSVASPQPVFTEASGGAEKGLELIINAVEGEVRRLASK
jgi:hypothetical protein